MPRVKVDVSGVPGKMARLKGNAKFGTQVASEAARRMDKYVPFRSGALAASVRTEPFKVTYVAPYARYVFEGRNVKFSKQAHPLARSHWHEPLETDPAFTAAVTLMARRL